MQINLKIEEIEELKELSETLQKRVIEEYKKGYHFLLFYGKFFVVIVMILSLEYMEGIVRSLPWSYKSLIYCALGYSVSLMIKIIEINIIAKKVIRDLIRDVKHRKTS